MIDLFRRTWRKSTLNKVFLIAAAAFFVGAAAGVTYAVIARPGDLAFMERPGADGKPVQLRWDRRDVPVVCFYLEDVPDAYVAAYERVRLALLVRAGGELLRPCLLWAATTRPKGAPDGMIILDVRFASNSAHGAETRHRYDKRSGRILSADVAFDRDLPAKLVDLVVLHEIGHALGLDHDRERSSAMYEFARGRSRALSGRDAESLSAAYVR